LFPQGTPADAVERPRTDTHAPDFGARVLSEETLRCSEGVVINDIRTTVNVYGHNFPPVGRLDLRTDIALVDGIATPGSLLSRIAGLWGGHRVSPNGNAGHLERVVQLLGKGLPDQAVLTVDVGDHCRALLFYDCYC
jgi:hypothetical protein